MELVTASMISWHYTQLIAIYTSSNKLLCPTAYIHTVGPSMESRSKGLDHAEEASTRFMVASGGVLSEGYGHDGPSVCLGDGQTEDEGVPLQVGRGDALLRRMSPYLT